MSERDKAIIVDYQTGQVSLRDLENKYGISFERIRQIVVGAGLPRNPPFRRLSNKAIVE